MRKSLAIVALLGLLANSFTVFAAEGDISKFLYNKMAYAIAHKKVVKNFGCGLQLIDRSSEGRAFNVITPDGEAYFSVFSVSSYISKTYKCNVLERHTQNCIDTFTETYLLENPMHLSYNKKLDRVGPMGRVVFVNGILVEISAASNGGVSDAGLRSFSCKELGVLPID